MDMRRRSQLRRDIILSTTVHGRDRNQLCEVDVNRAPDSWKYRKGEDFAHPCSTAAPSRIQRYESLLGRTVEKLYSRRRPEEMEHRKNQKYVPYEKLIGIPGASRSDRPKAEKRGTKSLALEIRNELIIQWLLTIALEAEKHPRNSSWRMQPKSFQSQTSSNFKHEYPEVGEGSCGSRPQFGVLAIQVHGR